MAQKWIAFLDSLKDNAGILAKDAVKDTILLAKNDNESFIKRQGEKLELYTNQLATGEVTKAQYEGYLRDLMALTEMQALKMEVAAKARAQKFANDTKDLFLNKLLSLI